MPSNKALSFGVRLPLLEKLAFRYASGGSHRQAMRTRWSL